MLVAFCGFDTNAHTHTDKKKNKKTKKTVCDFWQRSDEPEVFLVTHLSISSKMITGNEISKTAPHSVELSAAVENMFLKNSKYKIIQCNNIDNKTAKTTQILSHGGTRNND